MRRLWVVPVLLAIGPRVGADPPAPPAPPAAAPMTFTQAADAVLAAVRSKDARRLAALAATADPDPWRVADALWMRGERDAAISFARREGSGRRAPAGAARRSGRTVGRRPHPRRPLERLRTPASAEGRASALADLLRPPPADEMVWIKVAQFRTSLEIQLGLTESAAADRRETARRAERLGWLVVAADEFSNAIDPAAAAGDFGSAVRAAEGLLRVQIRRRNEPGVAEADRILGYQYHRAERMAEAAAAFERSRERAAAIGDLDLEVQALRATSSLRYDMGDDFERVVAPLQECFRLLERAGQRAEATFALLRIGELQMFGGAGYSASLRTYQEALDRSKASGDMGGVSRATWGIGHNYLMIGDLDHAREFAQKALAAGFASGTRDTIPSAVQDLATVQVLSGHPEEAVRMLETGVRMAEGSGDPSVVGQTSSFLALAYLFTRDFEKARAAQERSNAIVRDQGDEQLPIQVALYASILQQLGRLDEAMRTYDRARVVADRRGDTWTGIGASCGRTAVLLARHDDAGALVAAHEAVARIPDMARGLDSEAGSFARSLFADVYTMGVWAASRLGLPPEGSFFLESGRAGSLLEALGGRRALEEAIIPEALRHEEVLARARVASVQREIQRASERGDAGAAPSLVRERDTARENLQSVVARVQREARSTAHILHPDAIPLPETQRLLGADEAMVFYLLGGEQARAYFGLRSEGGIALVVTRDSARLVRLGATSDITAACEAGRFESPPRTRPRRSPGSAPSSSIPWASGRTCGGSSSLPTVPSTTSPSRCCGPTGRSRTCRPGRRTPRCGGSPPSRDGGSSLSDDPRTAGPLRRPPAPGWRAGRRRSRTSPPPSSRPAPWATSCCSGATPRRPPFAPPSRRTPAGARSTSPATGSWTPNARRSRPSRSPRRIRTTASSSCSTSFEPAFRRTSSCSRRARRARGRS